MAATLSQQPVTIYTYHHPGVIYAVRLLSSGLIKIGFTEGLYDRLKSLRYIYKTEVELLGVMPGTIHDEQEFHTLNQESCAKGREVYHFTPAIDSFIKHYLQSPESLGITLKAVRPYAPLNMASNRLTPEKTAAHCDRILRDRESPCDWQHRAAHTDTLRLKARLRQTQAAGYDIAPLLAIVRERLGLDLAELAGKAAS